MAAVRTAALALAVAAIGACVYGDPQRSVYVTNESADQLVVRLTSEAIGVDAYSIGAHAEGLALQIPQGPDEPMTAEV